MTDHLSIPQAVQVARTLQAQGIAAEVAPHPSVDEHADAKFRINCNDHGPTYYTRQPLNTLDEAKAKLADILDKDLCEYDPRIEKRDDNNCWWPVRVDGGPSNYLTITTVVSLPGMLWDDESVHDFDGDDAVMLVKTGTPHFFCVQPGVTTNAKVLGAEPQDWDRTTPIPTEGHNYDPNPYEVWLMSRTNGTGEEGQKADLSNIDHQFTRSTNGFLRDVADLLTAAVEEGAMPLPEPIEEVTVRHTADNYEDFPDGILVEVSLRGGLTLVVNEFFSDDLATDGNTGILAAAEAIATIECAIHREIEKFRAFLTIAQPAPLEVSNP